MRVLGVDPGFDRLGLAVLEGDPSRPVVAWSACITPPKGAMETRLAAVERAVEGAIREHAPSIVALETLFFSTNKKTAMTVAQARGAVLSAAGSAGVEVREFSPGTVKLAVTGDGRADKKAVAFMVPKLVALSSRKRLDDELDAIAIGICALASARSPQR